MRHLLASLLLLMPFAGHAAVTVQQMTYQKGLWQLDDCTPEEYDNCLCEADITYPQISGMPNAEEVNALLKKNARGMALGMGETSDQDACYGKKMTLNDETPSHTTYDYSAKVSFENDALLGITEDSYWYGEGAAHGNPATSGIVVDKTNGKVLDAADMLDMGKLKALNDMLYTALKNDERTFLYDCAQGEDDNLCKREEYVKADEGANLFVDAHGLSIVFNPYAVGPYASGMIDVAIPAQFVKHPAIKKLYGASHAG